MIGAAICKIIENKEQWSEPKETSLEGNTSISLIPKISTLSNSLFFTVGWRLEIRKRME